MKINWSVGLLAFYYLFITASSAGDNAADTKRQASKLRAEGDALLVSGDASGALSKYAQAINLEPLEVKNYLKSFRANDRLKRTQASIRDLSLAIEHDKEGKDLPNSLVLRANLFASLGRCRESLADWSQAISLDSKSTDAKENKERMASCVELLDRAENMLAAGDWQGAEQALTEAIDVSKTAAPELKKKRARARFEKGDHYECIADAGEVVKHDRNDVGALTLRGESYFALGDLEMALRHSSEALQSDPDFSSAKNLHKRANGIKRLISAGTELMNKKQWKDAAGKFDQILKTWDNLPNEIGKVVMLNICKCAGELKDRAWTHRACQKSIEYDERWIDSRITYAEYLAGTSESTEEWEETVRAWNAALQIDDGNDRARDGIRRAEAALKQSKNKNYYKILGVPRNADTSAIKKAYRELAKVYHPDRHQGLAEEELKSMQKKFADVAEAYEVLSDGELRGKYDRGEDVFENQGGGGHDHYHQHFRRGRGGGGFHWSFNF